MALSGGVPNNPFMLKRLANALKTRIGSDLLVSPKPDMAGGLGEALHGA